MYASKNDYGLREEDEENIFFHTLKLKAREQRKPFGESSGTMGRAVSWW